MALGLDLHLIMIIIGLQSLAVHSVSESEALIKLKSSLTNTAALGSWVSGSAPCEIETRWLGLICSHGNVTGLQLENMGLSGVIDVDALLELHTLRTVSFSHNSFAGNIPEVNRLDYLRGIYLSGNRFSGPIPDGFFSKMVSLKKLWLSENQFIDNIPSSLSELSNLMELHLENNGFSGTIPTLRENSLKFFNVSNNKLEGSIPPGLGKFDKSSFKGNPGLCGDKVEKICNMALTIEAGTPVVGTNSTENGESHKNSVPIRAIIGITSLCIMFMLVAGLIFVKMKWKRKTETTDERMGSFDDGSVEVQVSMPCKRREVDSMTKRTGSNRRSSKTGIGELVFLKEEKGAFKLTDLMKASAEILGNGRLGSSYKAVMTNRMSVVVKRMREMNSIGKEGFDAQLKKLGSLRHPNVLSPLAYHYRKDEKLFIHEYKPQGSLLYLLHGDHGSAYIELNWPTRLKIIQGIAKGLGYIHFELTNSDLPHGNLKSSNILMDSDDKPLLSEFGYRPLINPTMLKQALFAFKAPEAAQSGASPKSDVYCLGVIILEILTGKFPSQYISNGNGGTDIVEWVKTGISEGQKHELLDPEIASSTNSLGEIIKLLHLGSSFAETNPELRPEMKEAVLSIEEIQLENQQKTMQGLPNASTDNESRLTRGHGSGYFLDGVQKSDNKDRRSSHSFS